MDKNRYRDMFGTNKTALIVIHASSERQALMNLNIAREAGADGVFLINHTISPKRLVRIYELARANHPDWWIGLNCLGISAYYSIMDAPSSCSGVWADNAEMDESLQDKGLFARTIWNERKKRLDWLGIYFGGVAFKHQTPVSDLAGVSKEAAKYMDIVTTSGDATGLPPSIGKIKTVREAIDDSPLAIASGMTPENVGGYKKLADCFLVSTGVSKSFEELDKERVKRFIQALK